MIFCIAGHKESGNTSLAQRLTKLCPEHSFVGLSYSDLGEHKEALCNCEGVIITVNLMEGPMPGTRAAVSDCKDSSCKIVGFCFTHLDEFDTQTKYGPHIKELVEIDARELASTYGYEDDKIPAIKIGLSVEDDKKLKDYLHAISEYIK